MHLAGTLHEGVRTESGKGHSLPVLPVIRGSEGDHWSHAFWVRIPVSGYDITAGHLTSLGFSFFIW